MNEELNVNYNGKISYSDLRQIIFNYFKENQGIKLGSTSIGYLQQKLTGENDPQPFFIIQGEFGETRFDISKEDIQKILKSYLANKNCELSGLEFVNDVNFTYKQNPNIGREKEEKVELDITFNGTIDYTDLRQIIFDYYKETKGVRLGSTSIGYLQQKLTGGNDPQPCGSGKKYKNCCGRNQ